MFVFLFTPVPQAPPSSVKAEAESTTSIKVSWDKVPWKWRNGKIIRYSLEVYNGSSQQKVLNQTVDGNKTSYVVEGLQVYSNYSVQVRAETKLGSGPFSNKTYATTHQPGMNFNNETFLIGIKLTTIFLFPFFFFFFLTAFIEYPFCTIFPNSKYARKIYMALM